MSVQSLKTIKVTDDVHKRLQKRGEWGQPMTKIIEDLLDAVEQSKRQK